MSRTARWKRELNLLESLLGSAQKPVRVLHMIEREPIGRSRLLAEFCDGAQRRGWTVLSHPVEEADKKFGTVVDTVDSRLRHILSHPADRPVTAGAALTTATASPLPGSARADFRSATTCHPAVLDPLQDRPPRPHGLLLVLEDAHLADRATLDMLGCLLRQPLDEPLLVVMAVRKLVEAARISDALRVAGVEETFHLWEPQPLPEHSSEEEDDDGEGEELRGLSTRETQVARYVSAGCTNQQIASRLGLSQKTVETYMARIFKKLAVCSRTQIAYALGRLDALAGRQAPAG